MADNKSLVKDAPQNPSMAFGAPHGRAQDNNAAAIDKLTPPSGMIPGWTGASGKTGGK